MSITIETCDFNGYSGCLLDSTQYGSTYSAWQHASWFCLLAGHVSATGYTTVTHTDDTCWCITSEDDVNSSCCSGYGGWEIIHSVTCSDEAAPPTLPPPPSPPPPSPRPPPADGSVTLDTCDFHGYSGCLLQSTEYGSSYTDQNHATWFCLLAGHSYAMSWVTTT